MTLGIRAVPIIIAGLRGRAEDIRAERVIWRYLRLVGPGPCSRGGTLLEHATIFN